MRDGDCALAMIRASPAKERRLVASLGLPSAFRASQASISDSFHRVQPGVNFTGRGNVGSSSTQRRRSDDGRQSARQGGGLIRIDRPCLTLFQAKGRNRIVALPLWAVLKRGVSQGQPPCARFLQRRGATKRQHACTQSHMNLTDDQDRGQAKHNPVHNSAIRLHMVYFLSEYSRPIVPTHDISAKRLRCPQSCPHVCPRNSFWKSGIFHHFNKITA